MPIQKHKVTLTKSKLIQNLWKKQPQMEEEDIEYAAQCVLNRMINALAEGRRIEIRGFGSMNLHHRPRRQSRNPKTGEPVYVPEKFMPHFKPGNELRTRVNNKTED
ncbi:MAG: integration host factor subunit beta [Gammaproteobacteria bacterium]|nr:integration host factor subunit beta [Gammaproteobacteria bacterium]MCY4226813.1 integration host factor subunit beta [Gammaproteobacteria bacterium]MCY4312504.1 integration host factor subunit beta [Gammaproteobacteria bacterium]